MGNVPPTMSRLASTALLAALAVSALPATAQVSLQPAQTFPLPEQHSYFIGIGIPVTQTANSGRRVFLFTTQETYSSPLQFNHQLGWQKEFDLTPFNVNLFETSSAAINPADPNAYFFTGGLSTDRSIRFQQSPIGITANQRIGDLRFLPQNIALRPPATPGGPVEVYYTVSGYSIEGPTGDTPGIYRHADVDQMPWTNSTSIPASSGVGALQFGPDGLLNVIDTLNHTITRYDPDTLAPVGEFALGNTHTDRNAFIITPNGFVFTTFTDSAAGAIYSYATGEFIGNYGLDTVLQPGNGFGGKTSMTMDPDNGLVYVLSANSAGEGLFVYHSIDLMDPAIGTIHTFQPGDNRAGALETSSLHYLSLASGTATQSGVISGSGAINKKGFGTLVLSASNTYTGGTTVDNGTLFAAFTGEKGTFADHSTVTVNYWGTLAVDGESLGSGAGTAAVVLDRGTLTSVSTTGQATTLRDVTMTGGLITQSGNGRFILDGSITVNTSIIRARIDADLELRDATFNVLDSGDPERETIPLTITSTLSGSGSLTKNGIGDLYFTGTGTYTGETRINAGWLILGPTTSLASSSIIIAQDAVLETNGLTLASGQTLGGSGAHINHTFLSSGAKLAPGDPVGTLLLGASLTLQSGSILDFDLGSVSDLIRVSGGTLSSNGTITVNLTDSGGFAAGTYTLIDATGANLSSIGATSFTLGQTIAGYTYEFTQNGDLFQLIATSAIPEPASFAALAGLFTLALAATRRRRRAAV